MYTTYTLTETAEYQTMIACTVELRNAVSNNLIQLSGHLLARGLITMEKHDELRNKMLPEASRAASLVELVQRKVRLDPQNYFEFINILKEDILIYSDILRHLSEVYHSKGMSSVPIRRSDFVQKLFSTCIYIHNE